MKRLLPLLLLFAVATAFAQRKPDSVILDLGAYADSAKIQLPFRQLKVIDARFDRSNIGCAFKSSSGLRTRYRKTPAHFPDSLHLYLPQLLGKAIEWDSRSEDGLVMLVKQFRITDHLINGINLQYEPSLFLKISVSFFRQRNGLLTKLFSVDDLLSKKWPTDQRLRKEVMEDNRNEAMTALLQTVFENRNWKSAGNAFPATAVSEGLQKRFALPLLTDTVLQPGLYKNFGEFTANKPSLTAVKLGMRKSNLVEVKDSLNRPVDLRNYWGACDGKKRYVVFRGEFCELIPSDRSFRFLSYSQTKDLAGLAGYGDLAPQAGLVGAALVKLMDNDVTREYFNLNMDEGSVYLEEIFGKSNLKQMQKDLLK